MILRKQAESTTVALTSASPLKHVSIHSISADALSWCWPAMFYRCYPYLVSSVPSNLDLFHDKEHKTLLSVPVVKVRSLTCAAAAAWNWAVNSLTMHHNSNWNSSVKRVDQHRSHTETAQKSSAILIVTAVLGPYHVKVTFSKHGLKTGWWTYTVIRNSILQDFLWH